VTDPETPPLADQHCGFVAIVGAPNAGKSTLLNRLVGSKISIVSPKVQTTRNRVLGVVIDGAAQIVFIDTPGIFAPRRRLDRAMVKAAWRGVTEADLTLLLVDAQRQEMGEDTRRIIDGLKAQDRKALLALNKIDLIKRERLLELAALYDAEGIFSDVFMISAETGDGVDGLVKALAARMPGGPWHFPADQISDVPLRLLAAEVTREHLFRQVHDELPYELTVENESWKDFQDGSVRIEQAIYIGRETHKPILLGEGGRRIKSVRVAAQKELEQILERKVHLFLQVKVKSGWGDDPARYRAIGLEFEKD
jgi:GTP-binding protein Era